MARLLFEKTGRAVWISHLDLMRVFQRAFKRAGLPLTHTQGFNPRPSVSIALPMSVGTESVCELLDFVLEGETCAPDDIRDRLNSCLVDGVKVLTVYEGGNKIKNVALLKCLLTMEYDQGVPLGSMAAMEALFSRENLQVEKKGKNGIVQQDILPMIRRISFSQTDGNTLQAQALICCQNPSLNPMQIYHAVLRYLPEYTPDFCRCRRLEVYDIEENVFR